MGEQWFSATLVEVLHHTAVLRRCFGCSWGDSGLLSVVPSATRVMQITLAEEEKVEDHCSVYDGLTVSMILSSLVTLCNLWLYLVLASLLSYRSSLASSCTLLPTLRGMRMLSMA